jgi:hypothetical protein
MTDQIQVDHVNVTPTVRLILATLVTVLLLASATAVVSGGNRVGGQWTSASHSSIT